MFRVAEMHLIVAEAYARSGKFVDAATEVEKIKKARTFKGSVTKPTYNSQQEALKGILEERRIELAFEGHRYIDLKRLAQSAGVKMDRNVNDDTPNEAKNLENNSHKYTLPIPAAEITGNGGIQQNRGY